MSHSLRARLIQGQFICANTDAPSFERLRDDPCFREEISNWLEEAGFQLNKTSSESAFFSGIKRAVPREHATEIVAQFRKACEANAFAMAFMDAARASMDRGVEFKAGELLRSAEIYQAISASESHLAKLRKLWLRLNKKSHVHDHKKLTDALDSLAASGYLLLESKELGTYRVCGKIEHMFDLAEYVLSLAGVDSDDEEDEAEREYPEGASDAKSIESGGEEGLGEAIGEGHV